MGEKVCIFVIFSDLRGSAHKIEFASANSKKVRACTAQRGREAAQG